MMYLYATGGCYSLALLAGIGAHTHGPSRAFVADFLCIGTALSLVTCASLALFG